MRLILFILLLLTFTAHSQVGNKNIFFGSSSASPRPEPSFDWDALTPQSPTLYSNCGTVTVENKSFTNLNTSVVNGSDVRIEGSCNITFRNCYFGPSIRKGAEVEGLTGTVTFINCLFASNECGIEFSASSGNLQVDSCQFINPWGQGRCKGQAVQFSGTTSSNSYIRNCAMENFRGEGSTEDWISMFGAVGSVSNYIDVSNNYARGGGPSNSGGGFIAGDGDGRYIRFRNNKLFNPGNYILAAAGGGDIIIENNMGYQADNEIQNIAMYAYITNASTFCSNITITGNSMLLQNSNNYYCYCTPTCGDVIGVDESQGQPTNGWLFSNSNSLTLAVLNFPATIITFVDEDRLWRIRDESQQFSAQWTSGSCYDGEAQYARPTSNAGANQSIGGTSTTLNGSGSTSTEGYNYQWTQVSGPNNATIATPQQVSTTVSGLVTGVYEFRLVVTNNNGAADASWMTVTKT